MKKRIQIHKAVPNTGVLDASGLLDAPAGKYGFVQAHNGHLFFSNGQRAKFFGVNLPARSNTPTRETAEIMAQRFASMGINVVRLHAADLPPSEQPCSWTSCQETPLLDYGSGSSRCFHPDGHDRFDYFCAKLKEKGIYLHIDLYVARSFVKGDELDYDMKGDSLLPPTACLKCYTMVNRRLIELQKEYARELLCHINPYTGLALIDDPAVMTIQINNEDSVLKGTDEFSNAPEIYPYQKELRERFSHFLLLKYGSREHLRKAWTFENECALEPDEDPHTATVRMAKGGFLQTSNDPCGSWMGSESPARYADTIAFGMWMNQQYYCEMIDFLHALGAKVPISTSNLVGGAADVYSHSNADVMENNSYYHAPLFPVEGNSYRVKALTEYVSLSPLQMHQHWGQDKTTILSLAAEGAVAQKPFVMSEWNEYGMHPFHSTAFASTVAYACLNDWDGLILYAHHTSENWDDQPSDEIRSVFDAYNDPSLIAQWPMLARIFLEGLVAPSKRHVDVVYTPNDLLTLPKAHDFPFAFIPYVSSVRSVFLQHGETYNGCADIALTAGFMSGNNLDYAQHAVYYAHAPYRDAMRRHREDCWLQTQMEGLPAISQDVYCNEQKLVLDDISLRLQNGDYSACAAALDKAFKKWGVWERNTGMVEDALISDTGEISFNPQKSAFSISAPRCRCFSGKPSGVIRLNRKLTMTVQNQRITVLLLPLNGDIENATEYILIALGETGTDQTQFLPDTPCNGVTTVTMAGKLYADVWEGGLYAWGQQVVCTALNPTGAPMQTLASTQFEGGFCFALDGSIPAVHYHILFEKEKHGMEGKVCKKHPYWHNEL